MKLSMKKLREKRRLAGLCRCGRKRAPNSKMCRKCLKNGAATARRSRIRRRAANLCHCGNELDTLLQACTKCTKRRSKSRKATRIKRHAAGLCACGRKARRGLKRCARCSAYIAATRKRKNAELKLIVVNHYGGICACCGEAVLGFLTIDHVNGGGTKHRHSIKKQGASFYRWIIKAGFPSNLRVLCYNCNCGSAANGGICPHRNLVK